MLPLQIKVCIVIRLVKPSVDILGNRLGSIVTLQLNASATQLQITLLDELSFIIRLLRHTTEGSSFIRIMRLMPVFVFEGTNKALLFIPETHNPRRTTNVCPIKSVQTDNASSSIKRPFSITS